jgi:hypothetical protein
MISVAPICEENRLALRGLVSFVGLDPGVSLAALRFTPGFILACAPRNGS